MKLTPVYTSILIISLFSCMDPEEYRNHLSKGPVRMNVDYLANQIAYFTTKDNIFTGIKGNNSPEYQNFAGLLIRSGNKELIQLTSNKNPHVRVYACWALAKRYYPYMDRLMEKHLDDTTSIEYQYNGIVVKEKINSFLLHLLSPGGIDPYCKKLKDVEIGNFFFIITTRQRKFIVPPAQQTPVRSSKIYDIASP